jgi:hypothetical protein
MLFRFLANNTIQFHSRTSCGKRRDHNPALQVTAGGFFAKVNVKDEELASLGRRALAYHMFVYGSANQPVDSQLSSST